MNQNFWKGKTVLITGHTGFKGSWLSMILKKIGANVIGYSKDIPTNPSMFEIANVQEGMKSIMGDINDLNHINEVIVENKPEIVIHMAAQAIVRESYEKPLETFSTNVMGTVNVLEAIRNSDGVRVAIIVTSDKSYRTKKDHSKYSEDDPMGGYDPYSSSKGCAELVTSCYRNSFFNPTKHSEHNIALASVRAGNVIGGGDWAKDRLIPDLMRGILEKNEVKIRNPNSIRPWQFVLDPLNGYLMLGEHLWNTGFKFSEGWNFGPIIENEKPVSWIINKLEEKWIDKLKYQLDEQIQPHEEKILRLDCNKAVTKLGWKPKLSLEESLEWTSNWFKNYKNGSDMKEYSKNQINEFVLKSK